MLVVFLTKQGSFMIKPTALLTVALFFTVAPSPDAQVWSEMTGGFLKADSRPELSASELDPINQHTYVDSSLTLDTPTSF